MGLGLAISGEKLAAVIDLLEQYPVLGPLLYLGLTAASVVAAPFSSLPLIPFAAGAWGVPAASILNILGWWLGALIAFEIARQAGRPILRHLVSLERIDSWNKHLPRSATFTSIFLLRMILPVEVPSYALGLLPNLRRSTYAAASLLGIIPLAVVWTAIGGALISGQWLTLLWLTGLFGTALLGAGYIWKQYRRRK